MIKNLFYNLYKKMETNAWAVTAAHFLYGELLPRIKGTYRPVKYTSKNIEIKKKSNNQAKKIKDIKIAMISDDMTYENYKGLCQIFYLTPSNWFEIMTEKEPDIFFCEAAWSGISKYKNVWRGKIYSNKNIKYENRKVLFDILDFCKKREIKTAFWNKEDPFYFDDKYHNFSNTALKFDYIFTTDTNCVNKYKAKGHQHVFVSGFGFSPELFHYEAAIKKEKKAVFAGSWYGDLPDRCADIEKIFQILIEKKIPLEIYNRYYDSPNPIHKFPEKYKPFLRDAVSYSKLNQILNSSQFAININTVKNSETMFARRVFELMACKCIVISNESEGMEKMFGDKVWFIGQEFDFKNSDKIIEDNYQFVMKYCTNEVRLKNILKNMQIAIL